MDINDHDDFKLLSRRAAILQAFPHACLAVAGSVSKYGTEGGIQCNYSPSHYAAAAQFGPKKRPAAAKKEGGQIDNGTRARASARSTLALHWSASQRPILQSWFKGCCCRVRRLFFRIVQS